MDCRHREGRWVVKQMRLKLWEEIVAEIPNTDEGEDKWKPFALSPDGLTCYFRRYEPCASCKHGSKVANKFYERMN
jgi:hypothetical protein